MVDTSLGFKLPRSFVGDRYLVDGEWFEVVDESETAFGTAVITEPVGGKIGAGRERTTLRALTEQADEIKRSGN